MVSHQPLSPPHDISSHVLLCIVRSASLALLFASWTYRTSLANKLPLGHLSNLCHTRSHDFFQTIPTAYQQASNNPIHPLWLNTVCTIKELTLRNVHLRIYLCDIDYEIPSGITRDLVPLNTQQSRKIIDLYVTLILRTLMMMLRFQPLNSNYHLATNSAGLETKTAILRVAKYQQLLTAAGATPGHNMTVPSLA